MLAVHLGLNSLYLWPSSVSISTQCKEIIEIYIY